MHPINVTDMVLGWTFTAGVYYPPDFDASKLMPVKVAKTEQNADVTFPHTSTWRLDEIYGMFFGGLLENINSSMMRMMKLCLKHWNVVRLQALKPKGPQMMNIRMMFPFTMVCDSCKEYNYTGTKFTAKTEQIKGESYLGLKVRQQKSFGHFYTTYNYIIGRYNIQAVD